MSRYLKLAAVLGSLIVGMMFVNAAQASITVGNPYTTTLGTQVSPALGTWWKDISYQQQDKIWTLVATDLPADTAVGFSFFTQLDGTDVHILTLGWTPLLQPRPGTYYLDYNVAIDLTLAPNRAFGSVSLGATVPLPVVTVVKDVNGAELITYNGGTVGPISIPGALTAISVHETFTVDGNGVLTGTTNTYTQVFVPEPATMIVWSLLGAASWLGMRVWRRRGPAGRQSWSPENRQAILEIVSRGGAN